MLVCSYSAADDKIKVRRRESRPRRWLVRVYATDGDVVESREIRNKKPAMMSDMIEPALDALDDIRKDMPAGIDAGFQVFRLR